MKHLIALAAVLIPAIAVVAGITVVLFTPEVITEVIDYRSSHGGAWLLILIGAFALVLGIGFAAVVEDVA